MTEPVEQRARVALRHLSRGLTGKADFRLEVALAVAQVGAVFRPAEVSRVLAGSPAGRSDNVSRNLAALVDAGLLVHRSEAAVYERDVTHPFWSFVQETWALLLESAKGPELRVAGVPQGQPRSVVGDEEG